MQETPKPPEVDLKLRLGTFRLLIEKYRQDHGERAKFLCAAIMNSALVEPPGNDEAKRYLEENHLLIEQESGKLSEDRQLSLAFSILYSFTLIRIGPKDPERSVLLTDRATELKLLLLSTNEICPTKDAAEFLAFLDRYATELLTAH